MLEYLYTHKGKYFSGQGLGYSEALKKQKLNPKTFPKKELLCFFVQAPTEKEIVQMARDFEVDEKYFHKFKTETRSM